MKKHIYIFNEGSRASKCGIGTYVDQLIACFKDDESVSLHIVLLRSAEEFSISKYESYNVIHTPVIRHECNTIEEHQLYYRNAAYLIAGHIKIPASDKLIFHFNAPVCILILTLKRLFPESLTVYTIHVNRMCLGNKGNIQLVRDKFTQQENVFILPDNERQLFESVDHIICLSCFMKELLLDYYKISEEKVFLIQNGMKDKYLALSEREKDKIKRSLFISVDEKTVLFVGRLHEQKGIEVLIDAFKKVVYEIPDSKLIITGDGDFGKYLRLCEGYWNKISFTGLLDRENLYRFYQIADIGVIPSFSEQCNYVAIEMMMFDLSIIGTNAPGLDEMIVNEEDKIPIEYYGREARLSSSILAEKIVKKLKNKQTESNRSVYLTHYSLDEFRNRTKAAYNI